MFKKYWGIGAILVIMGMCAVLWFVFDRERITNDSPRGENIIAFGDSLTQGVGASAGHDYVSVLGERLGKPVINAGVSGNTTSQARERLERDVLLHNPKVVIVLLGGNDILQGVPPDTTFQNLATIIDAIQARGAAVVLVGLGAGFSRDPFGDRFKLLAHEKHTAFVSAILKDIINDRSLMADPLHPNDKGYAIMAERIAPAVEALVD